MMNAKGMTFFVERVLAMIVFLTYAQQYVQSNIESSDENHICMRTCEWPPRSRKCVYNFSLEWFYANSNKYCGNECTDSAQGNHSDIGCHHDPNCIILNGVSRPVLVVNRSMPGPRIEVCEGDTIVVHFTNNMGLVGSEGTTIHWHGITQHGTPHMDGTSMITQCPILIHQTFTYVFKASPAGTHWWHSHAGTQRSDGVFGPLVVRQAPPADPNSNQYDFDLSEHIIMVHDWFNEMILTEISRSAYDNIELIPDAILMNGKAERVDRVGETIYSERAVFNVTRGNRYRFRVISSALGYCSLQLSVDHHTLKLLATDGRPIKPFDTDAVVLHNAERFDFVLNADKEVGNYWIRVKGFKDCDGLQNLGIIHYNGAPEENPKDDDDDDKDDTSTVVNECQTESSAKSVGLADLTSAEPFETPKKADVTFYIGAQTSNPPSPGPTFNRITFKIPPSPLQFQWRDVDKDDFCDIGNYSNCAERTCECINIIRVKTKQVVELVFINEGIDKACHPIHIHGHIFHVVAHEFLPREITFQEFKELDRKGLIRRKLNSALQKDTVHIPVTGYLIVRFVADNPGWWYIHCHTEWHVETGMALVLQAGNDIQAPNGFPKCGSWSGESMALPPLSATANLGSNGMPSDQEGQVVGTSSSHTILVVLVVILTLLCLCFCWYAVTKCIKFNTENTAPDKIALLKEKAIS